MNDEEWMRVALDEAKAAAEEGEIPIGAAVVQDGELLAREHNRSIQLNDPTAHAEVLALRRAAQLLSNYRLPGVDLYVTVEPCAMCAGAAVWARVDRIVFGARDEKAGAIVSKARLLTPGLLNHTIEFEDGVLGDESRGLLRDFFRGRR